MEWITAAAIFFGLLMIAQGVQNVANNLWTMNENLREMARDAIRRNAEYDSEGQPHDR